jgi:predicted transcriptional regulator of viral defense system
VTEGIDQRVAAFAERNHGVFGALHLDLLGVAPHEREYRLRSGRWISLHDGVYRLVGTPSSWHGDVLAACWAGGHRAVASHRTAAEIWELPGRGREALELTCPHRKRARHDGLVVHESRVLEVVDITIEHRIPVTTVARTLFDLTTVRSPTTVDLALDNALRRDLTSLSELDAVMARLGGRGRRGTRRFRALLADRATTGPVTALRSGVAPHE